MDERALIDSLIAAILQIPGSEIEFEYVEAPYPSNNSDFPDAILDVVVAEQRLHLLVAVQREAFPRDVRAAIWKLRSHRGKFADKHRRTVLFFAAQAISPGARTVLREERVGYYDLGGSLYLPADGAFIFIDRPAPKKNVRAFDKIFQGQRARVLLAAFQRRNDMLSVKGIAEQEGISAATASETLREMERREWVVTEGSGPSTLRRLVKPSALIDSWAAFLSAQPLLSMTRYYVPGGDAEALAHKLDQACRDAGADYAITGELAAQIYAPYLTSISQVKCRIAPGRKLDEALRRLGARPVSEGWNFGLIETRARGEVMVGDDVSGLRLAPPLQVYLDLLHSAGRAKEMAQHLRTERLDA